MQGLRGGAGLLDLARGPGLPAAQAMQIDLRQDGLESVCRRSALAGGELRQKTVAISEECAHRFDAQRGSRTALLRASESVREWSKEVTRVGK